MKRPITTPDGKRYWQYADYLRSPHWQKTRKRLLGQCVCRRRATQLHHITYERIGNEKDSDLIGLCEGCHDTLHNLCKIDGKSISEGIELLRQRGRVKAWRPGAPDAILERRWRTMTAKRSRRPALG